MRWFCGFNRVATEALFTKRFVAYAVKAVENPSKINRMNAVRRIPVSLIGGGNFLPNPVNIKTTGML